MLLWFDTLTFSTSFLSGLASEANKSRLNVVKAKLALGLGQVKKDAAEASEFSSLFDPAGGGRRGSGVGGPRLWVNPNFGRSVLFSAVSTPSVASKHSCLSIFRDLQDGPAVCTAPSN